MAERPEWEPQNWPYLFRKLMEAYGYTLQECRDLSLPDLALHLAELDKG